jgi:hypothetical protein
MVCITFLLLQEMDTWYQISITSVKYFQLYLKTNLEFKSEVAVIN